MEKRTIRITGEGRKSYKPDQTIVRLNYEEVLPTYEEALKAATEYTVLTKKRAESAGIDAKNVTTTSFSIAPKTRSIKDANGNYHERLVGYEGSVGFSIKIPVDNALLSKLLYALREHEGTIRLMYVLKDRDAANDEVMELAVASAKRKAEILAKASGEKLGTILNIDYSFGRIQFEYDDDRCNCLSMPMGQINSQPEIDIDPEELVVRDTVNIMWALE